MSFTQIVAQHTRYASSSLYSNLPHSNASPWLSNHFLVWVIEIASNGFSTSTLAPHSYSPDGSQSDLLKQKSDHVTLLLRIFRWLSNSCRAKAQVFTINYKVLCDLYLSSKISSLISLVSILHPTHSSHTDLSAMLKHAEILEWKQV